MGTKVLRNVLFAVFMVAALAFGARAAAASPAPFLPCLDPNAEGVCTTSAACRSFCQQQGSPPLNSFCDTGTHCCYCNP